LAPDETDVLNRVLAERLPGDSLARPFLEMVFLTSPHLEQSTRSEIRPADTKFVRTVAALGKR